ncbi:hypothetical protein DH2020_014262 [Rehmannia glutinosa]|uniref:Uncharacterized protein n=1 Tax=Rehmannia glutinosa TaxID=99300 RepID=A0ABR0WVZ8_REHGL
MFLKFLRRKRGKTMIGVKRKKSKPILSKSLRNDVRTNIFPNIVNVLEIGALSLKITVLHHPTWKSARCQIRQRQRHRGHQAAHLIHQAPSPTLTTPAWGPRREETRAETPFGRPQGKVEVKVSVREQLSWRRIPITRLRTVCLYRDRDYPLRLMGTPTARLRATGSQATVRLRAGKAVTMDSRVAGNVVIMGRRRRKASLWEWERDWLWVRLQALGGLALAEGVDALEDNIAEDVADRVEDDLGYNGDDYQCAVRHLGN